MCFRRAPFSILNILINDVLAHYHQSISVANYRFERPKPSQVRVRQTNPTPDHNGSDNYLLLVTIAIYNNTAFYTSTSFR